MRGSSSMLGWRRLVVLATTGLAFSLLTTGGAAAPADRVAELRAQATSLAGRERAATLELYAIESELAATRARLQELASERAAAEEQLVRLRIQLDAAWQTSFVAEERLGIRLRHLYQGGDVDPVAILLGAESLDDAITSIEGLRSLAASDRELVDHVRQARAELGAAKRRVAARADRLRTAEVAAGAAAAALEASRSERRSYIAELAAERGFTASRIARARRTAANAARTTAAPAAASTHAAADAAAAAQSPAAPTAAAAAPGGARTLTVEATGYALRGVTATGIPTAWGVIAVDPSVIPLGTRLTIPGYGDGVAADTGGAVRGAKIDLWFPSVAEALAWGRRTVTITIHG